MHGRLPFASRILPPSAQKWPQNLGFHAIRR